MGEFLLIHIIKGENISEMRPRNCQVENLSIALQKFRLDQGKKMAALGFNPSAAIFQFVICN